jgi:hypothetical protein
MYAECRHIMPRGTKCKSPALKGRPYCYYHDKLHDYTRDGLREDKGPLCLPSIEDACGIQQALMQILGSMASGRLESRNGVRLIYGLQVAIQALDRVPQTPPEEMVQATACDGIGIDLADPEANLGEPHTDCPSCTNRFGCENVARQNKESLRHRLDEANDRPAFPGACQDREPLALPAGATDFPRDSNNRRTPERVLVCGEEERRFVSAEEEQVFVEEVMAAALPVLSPGAASPPELPAPTIGKQKEADMEANPEANLEANLAANPEANLAANPDANREAKREADLQARVNKFRTNKREADREARAVVLARMMSDHEITIEDIFALPEGSMEIPVHKEHHEHPARSLLRH